MTELVARMVLDLKLKKFPLNVKDTFAIEDSDLIEEVREAVYNGRVFYRAYRVKTGHGGYILNIDERDGFEEYEPIDHLDVIVSGGVKYKRYDYGEDNGPDNEWARLPYFKVPEWALNMKEPESD